MGCMAGSLANGLPGSKGYEPEIAINPGDLVTIQTIAILEIPEPNGYWEASFLAKENTRYGQFGFAHTTQAVLKEFLRESGFEIIEYSPNREHKGRLVYDYINLDIKGADAYLDIVPIGVGYRGRMDNHGRLVNPRPHVLAAFRLVLADSNQRLYAGSVQYGWKAPSTPDSITSIESPGNHVYRSSEALRENKNEAAEWLLQGIEAVSLSIGNTIVNAKLAGMATTTLSDSTNQPTAHFDVSGTYHSKISGTYQSSTEATIVQEGDKIKATFSNSDWEVEGVVVDKDTIRFSWRGSSNKGKGKLVLEPNGDLVGEYHGDSWGQGKWILTKSQ